MDGRPTRRGCSRAAADPLLALPPELLQRIFGMRDEQRDFVIPLEQRLRFLPVWKAWRAALDPRTLPIETLSIYTYGEDAADDALLEWVCRAQPRVEAAELVLGSEGGAVLVAYDALLSLHPRTVSSGTSAPSTCCVAW